MLGHYWRSDDTSEDLQLLDHSSTWVTDTAESEATDKEELLVSIPGGMNPEDTLYARPSLMYLM